MSIARLASLPVGLIVLLLSPLHGALAADNNGLYPIGIAKVDITPDYPIRLCGYAVRTGESQGVEQHVWAKALAIGGDADGIALLVTVDNTAVPAPVTEEVARR